MSLGREDATRIVRFCLAGSGWGSAFHEENLCVLKVGHASTTGTEVQRFDGDSFESVLRQAAAAGILKSVCLEKQIAFLGRSLQTRGGAPTVDDAPEAAVHGPWAGEPLFPAMTGAISALVHEIQVERGRSSVFLSSAGRLFGGELRGQWRLTDRRRADLFSFRRRHGPDLPRFLDDHLERAEASLIALGALRGEVETLQAPVSRVIDLYSSATTDLLSIIDGLARTGVEARSRPSALAWMALLHAKEKTGQERAHLANAFAHDHYAEGQHATVSALIAATDSYLHVFGAAAPQVAGDLLRRKLDSDIGVAVNKMERVALLKRDGGFGIDPVAWFSTISLKMDLLGDVESAVRATLSPGL